MSVIRVYGVAALLVLGLTSCFGVRSTPGGCQAHEDCGPGSVCFQQTCADPCIEDIDCDGGLRCVSGVCQDMGSGGSAGSGGTGNVGGAAGAGGGALSPPQIAAVSGNDPGNGFVVQNGLLLEGQNLGAATFDMRIGAGSPLSLSVPLQSDTLVELLFPADVVSGTYTLTATNAAGSDTATVTLELAPMDGSTLVASINDGATTGVIDAARQSPRPFASYRGYVPTSLVTFSDTYYGLIDPETAFAYGGITESGGDISVPRDGVYTVTAVAKVGLQSNAKGYLIVTRLDSGGSQIARLYLNDNDESYGLFATLAGTTTMQLSTGDRLRFEVASSSNAGSWNVQGGSVNAAETVVTVHLVHPQ